MSEALKPLTVGELLDRSFSLYRRHFVLFVGIAALSSFLTLLFGVASAVVGTQDAVFNVVGSLLGLFLTLVSMALSQGATVVAVSQIHLDRPTSIGAAFRTIRPRLGRVVLTILNMGARILIGLLFLVIPGLVLALMYALTIPVAIVEDLPGSAALSRSAELTKGHRGRILVIYVLLVVLMVIGGLLWDVPAMLLAWALTGSIGLKSAPAQVILQLGNYFSQAVLGPIVTIAIVLVYFDQRVRKEAFDLEHMMDRLDGDAATPVTSP